MLGHALAFSRDPLAFLERAVADCGDVVGLSVPGNDGVLVAHPDLVREVLVADAANHPKGDFQRRELSGLRGNGSLVADYRFEATPDTGFEPAVGVNLRPAGPVEVRVRER